MTNQLKTTTPNVLFEISGSIATITLNRPAQRNAVNSDLSDELRRAVDRIEADETLKVGILTGAGSVFCAGMDLTAFANMEAEAILFEAGGFGGFVKRSRRKPIIAAVNGAALAGGFELVLACDLVVSVDTAIFGLPESKIGLIAGGGGAFRLGQRLPKALANEILLTGEPISAARAYSMGLINKVVTKDELIYEATRLAMTISNNAPLSISRSLKLAECSDSLTDADCWKLNDELLKMSISSDDAMEGATAFKKKRLPRFKGR